MQNRGSSAQGGGQYNERRERAFRSNIELRFTTSWLHEKYSYVIYSGHLSGIQHVPNKIINASG